MTELGYISVKESYNELGIVEQRDYSWVGGDKTRVDLDWLLPRHYEYMSPRPGDSVTVGPYRIRILEYEPWGTCLALRERGFITTLRVWWHNASKMLDLAYRRLIITAAVWGLADYNRAIIPTWRDIRKLSTLKWARPIGNSSFP